MTALHPQVTAHWVEEDESGVWDLKNAIIGFTRLNYSHHGRRLGQALFKINERLQITARVGFLHIYLSFAWHVDGLIGRLDYV